MSVVNRHMFTELKQLILPLKDQENENIIPSFRQVFLYSDQIILVALRTKTLLH